MPTPNKNGHDTLLTEKNGLIYAQDFLNAPRRNNLEVAHYS